MDLLHHPEGQALTARVQLLELVKDGVCLLRQCRFVSLSSDNKQHVKPSCIKLFKGFSIWKAGALFVGHICGVPNSSRFRAFHLGEVKAHPLLAEPFADSHSSVP